jgi:fatty acid desaturase
VTEADLADLLHDAEVAQRRYEADARLGRRVRRSLNYLITLGLFGGGIWAVDWLLRWIAMSPAGG